MSTFYSNVSGGLVSTKLNLGASLGLKKQRGYGQANLFFLLKYVSEGELTPPTDTHVCFSRYAA